MRQKRYNKKKCVICQKSFIPYAPNQKTCTEETCKRKLHNQRIQRYRKVETKQTCKFKIILAFIPEKRLSFHDLEDQIEGCKNKRTTLYYALRQLKREKRINKIRGFYSLVPPILQGEKKYIIGNEYISIKFNDHEENFESFMEAEGYSWDSGKLVKKIFKKDNNSHEQQTILVTKKRLTSTEIKEGITIAIAAYIEIWAMLLANLIDARLQFMNEKIFTIREMAISTLFHSSVFIDTFLPVGIRTPISPGFSEILTLKLLSGKINQPEDIANLLKEIIVHIEKYLKHSPEPNCANIPKEQFWDFILDYDNKLCENCLASSINTFVSEDILMEILRNDDLKTKLNEDVLKKLCYYVKECRKRNLGSCCVADLNFIIEDLRKLSESKDVCRQIMRGVKDTLDMKGPILPQFHKI